MATRYAPIEDHGIIGDLHTVALVAHGRVDRLPLLPPFDSPSVFAALLDADRGGRFQIAPLLDNAAQKQLYLPDTNVLLTRFLARRRRRRGVRLHARRGRGQSRTTSCAARRRSAARCVSGCAATRASTTRAPRTRWSGAATRRCSSSAAPARASSRCGCARRSRCRSSTAPPWPSSRSAPTSRRGSSSRWCRRTSRRPARTPTTCATPSRRRSTSGARWIARSTYKGRWREMVNRSALALKLLTSQRARLDRRRADLRAARDRSAARATGTTATPGSATPRSRSTGSCGSATPTRPPPSCAG